MLEQEDSPRHPPAGDVNHQHLRRGPLINFSIPILKDSVLLRVNTLMHPFRVSAVKQAGEA
jgi:hypothetical protein